MDEHLRKTYDFYKQKLGKIEPELERLQLDANKYRMMIDQLLIDSGEQPEFGELQLPLTMESSQVQSAPIRTDPGIVNIKVGQFYGKPLTKAVKAILEMRGEPMKFSDILTALRQGGIKITGDADEKRTRLVMQKSTANFAMLPDKEHFMLKPKGMAKKTKPAPTQKDEDSTKKETPKG